MEKKERKPVGVVALGGNALLQAGEERTIEVQIKNAEKASVDLVKLVAQGYNIQLVHGNGPQVGDLSKKDVIAKNEVPQYPLEILGAQSQGLIGFIVQSAIKNELDRNGHTDVNVVTIVTRVEVDPNDEAFENPRKPIGQFYSKEVAMELQKDGYFVREEPGKGWRINTYSPKPLRILEAPTVKSLVEREDTVTISCGGGGIPVIKKDGKYVGIGGVIDKDRASCELAIELDADFFMILTDVEYCYINFKKENEQVLREITVSEAKKHIEDGQFLAGSMLPKVQSVVNFVEKTGRPGYITSLNRAIDCLEGKTGTKIIPDKE